MPSRVYTDVDMISKICIGVDPGQSGGLVYIHKNPVGRLEVGAIPMPTTERDIWDWFDSFNKSLPRIAAIEKVHAMPGQGVSSMFKFGTGYGGLRMAIIGTNTQLEEVRPVEWIKGLGIPNRKKKSKNQTGETNTEWKNRLKAKAQQLFPSVEVTKKTADALLIAEYCRRKHEGIL